MSGRASEVCRFTVRGRQLRSARGPLMTAPANRKSTLPTRYLLRLLFSVMCGFRFCVQEVKSARFIFFRMPEFLKCKNSISIWKICLVSLKNTGNVRISIGFFTSGSASMLSPRIYRFSSAFPAFLGFVYNKHSNVVWRLFVSILHLNCTCIESNATCFLLRIPPPFVLRVRFSNNIQF